MGFCDKHKIFFEDLKGKHGFTFSGKCPVCEEEFEKEEEIKMIEAKRQAQLRLFNQMNIEPEFYRATLENFFANTAEQKKAIRAIDKLILGEKKKIVMLGKNGTGKTHLAIAAVKKIGGAIYTMNEIGIRIRDSYSSSAIEKEGAILERLSWLPLLVIDELGRTKGSEAEKNILSYIIDKRHQRYLPLILISNKHHKGDCPSGECPDCFENFIGEDSMSRLTQNGILLRFFGDDWRENHRRTAPIGKLLVEPQEK